MLFWVWFCWQLCTFLVLFEVYLKGHSDSTWLLNSLFKYCVQYIWQLAWFLYTSKSAAIWVCKYRNVASQNALSLALLCGRMFVYMMSQLADCVSGHALGYSGCAEKGVILIQDHSCLTNYFSHTSVRTSLTTDLQAWAHPAVHPSCKGSQ